MGEIYLPSFIGVNTIIAGRFLPIKKIGPINGRYGLAINGSFIIYFVSDSFPYNFLINLA
jgi:hypothetical protein